MRLHPDVDSRRKARLMALVITLGCAGGATDAALAQALPSSGAEPVATQTPPTPGTEMQKQAASATATTSPYPDLLDGTLSVLGELEDDEAPHSSFLRMPTMLDPWFAWKRMLRDQYGFTFGGSWMVLWQNYSSSPIDQFNAVGSKLTLNFSYDLLHRNQPDALSFD